MQSAKLFIDEADFLKRIIINLNQEENLIHKNLKYLSILQYFVNFS